MTSGPDLPSHDQDRCGARTRSGGRCGLPAGWGTSHPGDGACRKHGGSMPNHLVHARRVAAQRAVEVYGLPVATTPERALLDEVARTNGHVAWLRDRVAGLEAAELASADGISVWLQLYQAERRHLVEVAKAAITCAAETVLADSARSLGQRMVDVLDRAFTASGVGWELSDEVLSRFVAELGEPGPDSDGAA